MRPPLTPPVMDVWPAGDGYPLHVRIWRTQATPQAVVLYLHGIQSHGGWFEWSASVLADAGCAVVLPDRRGSGRNPEPRGDVAAAERWLDDLDGLKQRIHALYPGVGLHVLGVSWGGKLAVAWERLRQPNIKRLCLVAPGIYPAVDIGLRRRLHVLGTLLSGAGGRQFAIPLNDPELFTDNPAGQAFIAGDPQKLTHATARFLFASARLDWAVRRLPTAGLRSEVTLLTAGRDRIINNEKTIQYLESRCTISISHVHLPDAAHTLEFAANVSQYQAHLRRWADDAHAADHSQM